MASTEIQQRLMKTFEDIKHVAQNGDEVWSARELAPILDYGTWENFHRVIERAIESCKTSGIDHRNHFRDVTKMVSIGSGIERGIMDYELSRYACYLIAQNGSPTKEAIAAAQMYFAVQTRRQEVMTQQLIDMNHKNIYKSPSAENQHAGWGEAASATECDDRFKNSTTVQCLLQGEQQQPITTHREAHSELLEGERKMNDELFKQAVTALQKNPSEGQVEKSVVFPILELLGYKSKNVLSKIPIRVKAGSKKYETLQSDIIAKEDKELPTLVVEAKSPKRGLVLPDDHSQGMSYCYSPDVKAKFLFLTSGYSNRLYEGNTLLFEFDLKNMFASVEKFRKLLIGVEKSEKKQPTSQDVLELFSYSNNRMYGEDAIGPQEALDIVTKLFLIKTHEERGKSLYNLRIILEQEEAYANAKTPQQRKNIEESIYKYLSDCLKNIDTDLLNPEERHISRNISLTTLFDIVKRLYDYTLDSIPVQQRGSAFDSFLNNTMKGRALGQVFTHRNIVHFIVDITTPQLKDKIIDPACGTGGFIETAFMILHNRLKKTYDEESEDYKKKLDHLKNAQIFGIEKDGNIASLAKLSMSMNGDGHTSIFKGNGLTLQNEHIQENSFDIILTNPPFGSKSVVQVKDKNILALFDMGKQYRYNAEEKKYIPTGKLLDGQDIGVLFLERCIKLLKPGGLLAIIIHDGVFSNSTRGYIRQYIRDNCEIIAVVKLTDETFKPYNDGGGTEATILFCRKGQEVPNAECFFAIANHVGYRFKRHKIISDTNDLPQIHSAYQRKSTYADSKWVKLSSIPRDHRIDAQYRCKQQSNGKGTFTSLGDNLEGGRWLTGFPFASAQFGKGEKKLVKIAHLNNSLLDKESLECIPMNYYKDCKTVTLREGDILLAMDGKNEFRASYVDATMVDVAVNQRVAIIRVDKKKIPASYVFLVLISKFGQRQLLRDKTQTATVAHLSPTIIKSVQIPTIKPQLIYGVEKNFKNYVKSTRNAQSLFDKLNP